MHTRTHTFTYTCTHTHTFLGMSLLLPRFERWRPGEGWGCPKPCEHCQLWAWCWSNKGAGGVLHSQSSTTSLELMSMCGSVPRNPEGYACGAFITAHTSFPLSPLWEAQTPSWFVTALLCIDPLVAWMNCDTDFLLTQGNYCHQQCCYRYLLS